MGKHAVALIREYHPGLPGTIWKPHCICGWMDGAGWSNKDDAKKRALRHERAERATPGGGEG